jgi:hypothetical protein
MYYMRINKNFVYQVGDQPRLYYDVRCAVNQSPRAVSIICVHVCCQAYYLNAAIHNLCCSFHLPSVISCVQLNFLEKKI